jgi:predicted GNAT family N-acyltransferase
MSTEFLTLLSPPGAALAAYDRTKRSDQQPGSIPQLFKDAMSVREAVYVEEQGVPLANELDDDDARSWHWIVYASVGTTSTSSSSRSPPKSHTWHKRRASKEGQEDADRRRSSVTASRVPVGTIRLIPPPHPPNPYITHDPSPTATAVAAHDPHPDADPPAPAPLPTEPFVKLGRLATLPAYRKLGLSQLLINAAQVLRPPSPATLEAARLEGREEEERWRGLAMVHAQISVEGLWAKFGFREELKGVPKEGRW